MADNSEPRLVGRRILVTGATGTVGYPVTLALAGENDVSAVARFSDPAKKAALEAASVRCISRDLTSGDFTGVPDDVDHVINFLRPSDRLAAVDFDLAIAGHAESIGLLMAHCRDARSVLHCSSTSLYRRRDTPAAESDPLTDDRHAGRPTYTIAKICAEAVVKTMARQFDLPTTIARLNVPYGDDGGWPAIHLDAIVAGTPVVVSDRGPSTFNPIHVDDIVRTIPALLQAASVPATIVNWAGASEVSIEEWADYLASLVGRPVTIAVSPDATERMTVDTTRLTALAGPMTVDWREGMRRLAGNRYPDLVKRPD